MTIIAGLDVGGAHLKVALAAAGRVVAVRQIACPLWQGLDKLDAALGKAHELTSRAERHAVTMTGELSDLFCDRRTGVEMLVARLDREYGPATQFWMGAAGFGFGLTARARHTDVGSTNFLATATLVGRRLKDALLIDFGSTTADIVAVRGGKPAAQGFTDGDRLASGELVYTGLTRTSAMGVTTRGVFRGRSQGLAREHLATMGDVRRILGTLPQGVDQHGTPDGRGMSLEESVARLARLFGRDAADGCLDDWRAAAALIREEQVASIIEGCRRVLSMRSLPADAPIVAAGIGADDVAEIAGRLGRQAIPFGTIANAEESCRLWATRAAPAVAVALLLTP